MEDLDFNTNNLKTNSIIESLPNPKSQENSQSSESEKQFQSTPKQEQSKGVIEVPKTTKITKIQKSLDTCINH